MEAIRLNTVVEKDGELFVTGLPCQKGQQVEMIVLIEHPAPFKRPHLTARQLLHSELIGVWKDRDDIKE